MILSFPANPLNLSLEPEFLQRQTVGITKLQLTWALHFAGQSLAKGLGEGHTVNQKRAGTRLFLPLQALL